jgi:hypothetical protein
MSFDRLRSDLDPLRNDDPPRAWWDVLLWIPLGFAVTQLVGDSLPALAMVPLGLLFAVAHHYGPATVEVVAGAGGLIASGANVWDGAGCQTTIGDVGVVVIIVFGSILLVSSFVRLIGAASLREMGKHLVIATATVEISLFAVSPSGEALIDRREVYAPALLAAVLLVVSQIGLIDRMELGMLSLGVLLLPVQVSQALGDNPCGAGGFGPLLGMTVFAGASYSFATARPLRSDDEDDEYDDEEETLDPFRADENFIGAWVDATPESPVWTDPDPEGGAWVDHTPETGVWLDDDYEDEFRDPNVGHRPATEADSTYDDEPRG